MIKPRIDQFLYHTSFFKSRAEAQDFISSGFVTINSRIAKPSSQVKDGDEIRIMDNGFFIVIKAQIQIEDRTCYVGYTILNKGKEEVASC
jgi:ribosomal 50S subunit-recycling heat shock protein